MGGFSPILRETRSYIEKAAPKRHCGSRRMSVAFAREKATMAV
jgi:hypothetical protein